MMDPPLKLFGQTIAFTTSASSQDDTLDGVGATSSGAWEELSSSPQDGIENGAESGVKSELTHAEYPSGCLPEPSSSGSTGTDEDKISSSPREVYVRPLAEASTGLVCEGTEDVDTEDAGFTHGEELNGEDVGGKGPKMPKRLDKAVACPRCHSLETKFCYYNNYNVNQPRHFCKHCQRYWTAGGTLRNVPVGAGRRKNKHGNVVPPRQNPDMGLVRSDEPDVAAPLLVGKGGVPLAVPLQVPVVQTILGGSLPCSPKPIIRVPVAGSSPDGVTMQYSMRVPSLDATYILTSAEPVKPSDNSGGLAGTLPHVPTPPFSDVASCNNEVDGTCGWPSKDGSSCATASGHGQAGSNVLHSVRGDPGAPSKHSIKDGDVTAAWSGAGPGGVHGAATGSFGFFNGGWPYGYNVGWRGGAAFCTAGGVASVGNALPPPPPANVAAWSGAAAAGNMWTGMPWPMPGLSWSPTGWGPPPWSIAPWAMGAAGAPGAALAMPPAVPGAGGGASALPTQISCPAGPPGGPLGKHARPFEGGTVDGTVWAPKSLRMADPEEALRSSVWRILGVGGSHPEPAPASTFKAFQPKCESKKVSNGLQQTLQTTLHANPAAMYRSMYFHESN